MPYIFDPNLENEEEQTQAGMPGNDVKLSGGSSTNEQSPSAPSGGSGKGLNTGSHYQNLDKYLSANQSKQFGQQVLGKVQEKVDTAQQNQQSAADQFKNQVNSANVAPSQEQVNQALANPSQANANDFQKWMTQSYSGPKSLGDEQSKDAWNKYWSGTNQAQAEAKSLGSEAGRFALLDQYFGKPTYSTGQKSLDNLLVQQGGIGQQQKALQNEATQLKSQGQQQANELTKLAAERAGAVDSSRAYVNDQFKAVKDAGQKEVNDAVSAENAKRASELNSLRSAMDAGALSPEQYQALGLTPDQRIYNLNLQDYLNPMSDLTRDEVMTGEQRARLQALNQLAGITDDEFLSGTPQTAHAAYSFDSDRLRNDASTAAMNYENELRALVNAMNSKYTGTGAMSPEDARLFDQLNAKYGVDRTASGGRTVAGGSNLAPAAIAGRGPSVFGRF